MIEFLVLDSEIFGTRPALPIAIAGVPRAVVCPAGPIVGSAVGGDFIYPGVPVGDLAGVGGGPLDYGWGAVVGWWNPVVAVVG